MIQLENWQVWAVSALALLLIGFCAYAWLREKVNKAGGNPVAEFAEDLTDMYRREACTSQPVSDELLSAIDALGTKQEAFTLRPDWSKAPEWAMWAAQDDDGEIYWFSLRPIFTTECEATYYEAWAKGFDTERDQEWDFYGQGPANPNWKQAIEQRPAVAEKATTVAAKETSAGFLPRVVDLEKEILIPRSDLTRLRTIELTAFNFTQSKSEEHYLALARALGVEP